GSLTRAAGEDVGAYAIGQGTLAAANYSITFVSASFTITAKPLTVTAVANSKVFGATDPAFAYTNSLGLPASAFTGSLTRVAGENVGAYAIGQGTLAAANYSITFVSASFTITAKPLTVTAVANSKVFGASDPTFAYTNSLGLPASAFTGSLTSVAGEDVGTYAIEQGTLAAANYSITFVSASFTITAKPLTVTAVANSKVFGATDPAFAYTNSEGLPASAFTGSLTRVDGEDVGTYAIEQGTLVAANYSITFVSANLTITAKPLTVTAVANSKVFGATDPAFAHTYSLGLPSPALPGRGQLRRPPRARPFPYRRSSALPARLGVHRQSDPRGRRGRRHLCHRAGHAGGGQLQHHVCLRQLHHHGQAADGHGRGQLEGLRRERPGVRLHQQRGPAGLGVHRQSDPRGRRGRRHLRHRAGHAGGGQLQHHVCLRQLHHHGQAGDGHGRGQLEGLRRERPGAHLHQQRGSAGLGVHRQPDPRGW